MESGGRRMGDLVLLPRKSQHRVVMGGIDALNAALDVIGVVGAAVTLTWWGTDAVQGGSSA